MLKTVLLFINFFVAAFCFAQKKNGAIIVVGRQLSAEDSLRVNELFYSGLREKAIQKFDESAAYFKAVLERDPANAAALYELANYFHAKGDEKVAETYARQAVTVKSGNKWYWLLLADIYKRTNSIEPLVLVFDELIKLEPQNEDYYYDKANALTIQKKVKEAEALYAVIEEKFGGSHELVAARQRLFQQQGNAGRSIAELEKLIAANPADLRNYHILAEIYQKEADLDKALEVLQKAKKVDPKNAFVRLALADIYNAQNNADLAHEEVKASFADPALNLDTKVRVVLSFFPRFRDAKVRAQATELAHILTDVHSSDPKSFSVYGDVLFQDNKLDEAKKAYRQALSLNNEVYLIWEQLLRLSLSKGDYADVIKDGEEALTLFPNQSTLYFLTGLGYSQNKKHEKAVDYFQNALTLEAENKELQSQIYSSLGDSYNALQRFKESDASYEKALELSPDNTYVLNNYAYYLSLRGEALARAEEMSLRSNKLMPDNASFEDTYAWVLFKQKKFAEAKKWIEKAIKHNSNSGVQLEHYGDILFNLGEKEQALEQWRKAKEKGVRSEILEKKINGKKFLE
ncbi:tetratricopeptide repeat protein [Pedobacter sp. SYSU D00535]|uniref:tetratricopeptide repeat protein n=1 Tax=Pedobacter sp. SYSU D00535 TaxID=2810308 RepID=UPI001A96E292|nr:tetratricopeptide repeat protein [Pedobacter sp. SYSU D00535]